MDPTASTAGVTPAPSSAQAQQYSYGYGSMSYWYPQGYPTQGYMQAAAAGYPYQQYQYQTAAGAQQYCVVPQQGQWTGQPGQQPNGPVMYATMQKYPTQ